MEEPALSAPSATRSILDHAATEPETPKLKDTAFDRELERVRKIAAYFDNRDPINVAIRRHPTRAMFIAAGVGFGIALLMRRGHDMEGAAICRRAGGGAGSSFEGDPPAIPLLLAR